MIKWFGPDWGAPVCRGTPQVLTPEGKCTLCGDAILQGNQGFVMPHVEWTPNMNMPTVEDRPVHLECHLLNIGVIKVVHVLHGGVAICGLPGIPSEWPEGHRWVRLEENTRATCSTCRARASAA